MNKEKMFNDLLKNFTLNKNNKLKGVSIIDINRFTNSS